MKEGIVIYEFCDDPESEYPITFQIIDWKFYTELSMVLVNIDKRDGSISHEYKGHGPAL